jgi:hypothetical protein
MFKKAKTKSAQHTALPKKGKIKQRKTLIVAKPVQKKQMAVKTPKQIKPTHVAKPVQKKQAFSQTPKQRKTMSDEEYGRRLKAVIG